MRETEIKNETKEYVCEQRGYIYNLSKGDKKGNIPSGVPFENLPDDWTCPLCGAKKSRFAPMLG